MARRALEIGAGVETWTTAGNSVGFMTFTVRHKRTDSAEKVWSGVSRAWARTTSGKGWNLDKDGFGIAGYLKVVEVTHGLNGWHVHIHALMFLEGQSQQVRIRRLQTSMFSRWRAGAIAAGLEAPLRTGQDARLVTDDVQLSQYLAKQAHSSIGVELTASQSKQARGQHGTQSVWAIFEQARMGLAREVALWQEFERVSKGKRQMTWSMGLRAILGLLAAEQSDEDIAAEELGTADDTIAILSEDGWAELVGRRLLVECLQAAEKSQAALQAWLLRNEIEHFMVGGLDEQAA